MFCAGKKPGVAPKIDPPGGLTRIGGVNGAVWIGAPTLGLVGKNDRVMVPIGPGIAPAAVLSTFPMKPNSPGSPISSDLDMKAPPEATPARALLALSAPLIVRSVLLDCRIFRESDAPARQYPAV